jgi:16S rRNA (guanine966-N2)-methyltransferase
MRVIAGEAKGKKLVAPAGTTTRPAAERLRESLFGMLGERVEDARVLDLFAGSGALGIEALSRGAREVTFVERDDAAIGAIRRNLTTTGYADRGRVVRADVSAYLRRAADEFDLVFCDPPYADVALLADLLAADDLRRVTRGALVVRTLRKHAPPAPPPWTVERERDVGEDLVRFLA